jgi:hypothetical protein
VGCTTDTDPHPIRERESIIERLTHIAPSAGRVESTNDRKMLALWRLADADKGLDQQGGDGREDRWLLTVGAYGTATA